MKKSKCGGYELITPFSRNLDIMTQQEGTAERRPAWVSRDRFYYLFDCIDELDRYVKDDGTQNLLIFKVPIRPSDDLKGDEIKVSDA